MPTSSEAIVAIVALRDFTNSSISPEMGCSASTPVKLAAVVQVMDVGACEAIHGDNIENFHMEEAMRLSMQDDITAVHAEATTVSVTMEVTTVSAANPKRKRNTRSRREERRAARINKLPMI